MYSVYISYIRSFQVIFPLEPYISNRDYDEILSSCVCWLIQPFKYQQYPIFFLLMEVRCCFCEVKVKQTRYRPGVAQRVLGS
jgi:hypothetical protein